MGRDYGAGMAKSAVAYECTSCGWRTSRWAGRCGECQQWGTVEKALPQAPPRAGLIAVGSGPVSTPAVPIGQVNATAASPSPTGLGELDRVLGGGLVPGAVILLAGEPGVGKSTLLLEACASAAASGPVLYVTAEESAGQVRLRADRVGAIHPDLYLAAETGLAAVLTHIEQVQPRLLIVDSVQTVAAHGVEGVPGGVTQIRAVSAALASIAKDHMMTTVLVGHVTKDGTIAGPRALEHLVDVVLYFEGERHSQLRIVRAVKNRYGSTDEIGCFSLGEDGLTGLPDPSGLFLSHRHEPVPGTCVTVALEGRRALVAEVQALTGYDPAELPRRVASGLDHTRLGMLVAVLKRRTHLKLAKHDVYAATVGGVKLTEPAVDLAVALAIASTTVNLSVPGDVVAFGEVGLAGEVRRVPGLDRRVAEAGRLGFRRAIVPISSGATVPGEPAGKVDPGSAIEIREVPNVTAAIAVALGDYALSDEASAEE